MFTPIATAKREGRFTSIEAVARQVKAIAPELPWPQDRSLAVKIGAIDRGGRQWWLSRPDQSKILADAIGLPLADLGLESAPSKASYTFPEFPELPALILGEEPACPLSEIVNDQGESRNDALDEWLEGYKQGPVRNPMAGITWLEVPPGTGLSLLVAKFSALCRFDFTRVRCLHELGDRLRKPSPLVVAISEQAAQQDLIALANAHRDTAILVIAPFAFASKEDDTDIYSSWEFQEAKGTQRSVMLLTDARSFSRLNRLRVRLVKTWQTRFLAWVEDRLDAYRIDSHFSANGVSRWLEPFKGLDVAIRTPGELLGVCRFCHRLRETQLPRASDMQAGTALLQCLVDANPGQLALASLLIARCYRQSKKVWGLPMELREWGAFCPEYPGDASQEELMFIARLPHLSEREKAARELRAIQDSRRISGLIDCGLLAEQPDGQFQLMPRFVIDLIARDHMLLTFAMEPVEAWAILAYDTARRPVLETALACLSLNKLEPLAAFLASASVDNPYAIGVSELLFHELAQRLREGVVLEPIFAHVARHVASHYALKPLSHLSSGLADNLDWLSSCWVWSLAVPTPDAVWFIPWMFPGWSEVLSADPRGYLPCAPDAGKLDDRSIEPEWLRMFEVAGLWVRTLGSPPALAPEFTWPHLLLGAALGRWPAQPNWWRQALECAWASEILMSEYPVGNLPGAGILISSLINFVDAEQSFSLSMQFSLWPILHWLLSNLSDIDSEEIMTGHCQRFFLRNPEVLPPRLRKLLLTASAIRGSHNPYHSRKLLSLIDDPDTLLELVGGMPEAARYLWAIAPQRAIDFLLTPKEISMSLPACKLLVEQCPAEHVTSVIAHFRLRSDVDLGFLRHWVLLQLQKAEAPTVELLKLLKSREQLE